MSWEDAAGFVICLGGLNPLCWTGCSSPSEAELEDEDTFPPPADHYVPPDTDAHILPDTPDTHDTATDSDSDAEDSTEFPFLLDISHPDTIRPDTEDGEDISKPETDVGTDLADTIDTEDALQDTESKADTPEDADMFGDTTEHTDSMEETDTPEIICVPEKCDGEDNDCDGLVDEDFAGLGNVCELGEGICYSVGYYVCSDDGAEAICDAEVIPPQEEACDGLDNNCNGKTDEVCACIEKTYEPVTTECGEGACYSTGETSCKNGKVKDSCEPGQPLGTDDTCDGIDDDCDGLIDNEYIETIITCGIGACEATVQIKCVNGVEDECVPGLPTFEVCDGLDNDCDNKTDEELGLGEPCTVGIGACANSGVTICNDTGGTKCSVSPKAPAEEACDGKDNDCDGATDEGCACVPGVYTPIDTTCGVGACKNESKTYCDNGVIKDKCTPKLGSPDDQTCDGIDDDCDGLKDDDYMAYQITCGIGPCEKTITTSCTNGAEDNVCTPGTPTPEICDEIDNNCNGPIDEGMADNDNDGKCNEVDCEIDGPLDKYLVFNCYSDPGITAKMSVDACWSDLTNSGTLPGEIAYIGIEYFNEGVSFNGAGIKLCVHPLWTDCDNSEPLPIACDHEIEFETKLLGTQYIWNLISPDPDAYTAEFHFDQTKNPDVASIQIFLYMNNAGCNYLYNAFSCN